MSRSYRITVIALGVPEETLEKVMTERFGWEGQADSWDDKVYFTGEGALYGGKSEHEAHDEIAGMLKSVYPEAKVCTQWTYLDDLPYEEYGDAVY